MHWKPYTEERNKRFADTDLEAILIRRCHAAESQLTAIRDQLTPLLGKEVCGCDNGSVDSGGFTPWGEPINIACPDCNGTGQRNIADGLSVVECVQEAANELKEAWAFDEQRVEWQQKAEQERDALREQVAKLRDEAHAERKRAVEIALNERESLLSWSRTCTDDDGSRRSFIECANTANAIANAICPILAGIIRNAPPTPSEK